jgi:outer membrane scaffolding protein for murein synthesis (MipA/OmpV family)
MKPINKIAVATLLASTSTFAFAGVDSDIGSVPDLDAANAEKDWSGMLGLAVLSAPEYWGSEDTEGTGVPVIIVDYKDTAYFKVNRAGYWFWKPNDNFRVGALLKIRPAAWEDDDDSIEDLGPIPAGFDEPDAQGEAGVNFLYKKDRFSAEAQLTSGEDVNLALNLDYKVIQSAEFVLTARLGIEQLGEDTVLYNWYGDDDDSFDPDSASNTTLGLIGIYTLSKEWKLFFGATSTTLDDEIEDSPIGDDDTYTTGFIVAGWTF